MYQRSSMSMRASVPRTCAVFGPSVRSDDTVDETAPEACVMAVTSSVSAPVSPKRATARTSSGSPRTSHTNEIG